MKDEIKTQEILTAAKKWFKETIAENHVKNTVKLINPDEFNINPFLSSYLARFLSGNNDPVSIAKALIYPRVLGTSINTSFGQHSQKFTTEVLGSLGSVIPGIDIEFIDKLDGHKKYCQLKSGPNTINKDDIETIHRHFSGIKNLARTNHLKISLDSLMVGVLYGNQNELSRHYQDIEQKYHYSVSIGEDFWYRLTGTQDFYFKLIESLASVAQAFDGSELLNDTINKLAKTSVIKKLSDQAMAQ